MNSPGSAPRVGRQLLQAAMREVESALARASQGLDPAKAAERAHFMKTKLPMHGLTVPGIRKLGRGGFSFTGNPPGEVFSIWSFVWENAGTHEASLLPIYYLESLNPLPDARWLWPEVSRWAARITCWDQSDGLSGIYSQLLESAPELVYPDLKAWNSSSNPWERRQSLVSLFYYRRIRTVLLAPDQVFELVEARLSDPDYYVQKGLGWCLKEAYQAWPGLTCQFLEAHAGELAPAAWQAATEKIPPEFKARLKEKRLGLRRQGNLKRQGSLKRRRPRASA